MVEEVYIGISELTKDDIHYAFAVLPRLDKGKQLYEFRLVVTNNSDINKLVNFPTHQRADFFVKEGDRIVWNFGFWRYWAALVDSTTILPSESLVFSALWDGMENSGVPAAKKLFRFEGQFLATVGVPVGFTGLFEWKEPASGSAIPSPTAQPVLSSPPPVVENEVDNESGENIEEEPEEETQPPAEWF